MKIVIYSSLIIPLYFQGCKEPKVEVEQPNVLFISVDDLLPVLGCYGDSTIISPNIDRLASNGVMFTNAHCQSAICGPSRSSFMTGLRPDELKVWSNRLHFRDNLPDVVTLPQLFKNNGYSAREIGKIYHDPASHKDPVSWSGPSYYHVTQNLPFHKYALPENYDHSNGWKAAATESADVSDTAYIDGKVFEVAIKVLNEIKDSTFFLAVGFRRPHLPFSAPKKYWDLYLREQFLLKLKYPERPVDSPEIAFHNSHELTGYEDATEDGNISYIKQLELLHGYYASISFIDEQIGKLLAELERLELSDNTIIVLFSDHGFHLGDFGLWGKTTNFEASTRVPLMFSGPGIKKGVNSSIVELIDIYPTLVELANLTVAPLVSGNSLLPVLQNIDYKREGSALSQIGRPYHDAVSSPKPGVIGYSIRTPEYRYTEWRSFPDMKVKERELYDMFNYNVEKQNIAGDQEFIDIIEALSLEIDNKRKRN